MPRVDVASFVGSSVEQGGEMICLSTKDDGGQDVEVRIPFDQLGALAMTLPILLSRALRQRYGDESLRYVYPLGDFKLESSKSGKMSILSLNTPDGFEVSFSVPFDHLAKLAATCQEGHSASAELVPEPVH